MFNWRRWDGNKETLRSYLGGDEVPRRAPNISVTFSSFEDIGSTPLKRGGG